MKATILSTGLSLLGLSSAVAVSGDHHHSKPRSIPAGHLRVPPAQGCAATKNWIAPDPDLIASVPKWYFEFTSNPFYVYTFQDYQESYVPTVTGEYIDLTTTYFNKTLGAAGGVQSEAGQWQRTEDPAHFIYTVVGAPGITNNCSIIGYGTDSYGKWAVIFETPVDDEPFITIPGGIDFFSESRGGPAPETIQAIQKQLTAFNCPILTNYTESLLSILTDDGRP
ncbi:hypothetical protein BGZ63DRAFT_404573 [Mariannaea sp. PMI_226]|nr:hypothetical protein BGZ63DRAFT_404573 [Mariannaea sp. PMI_226]